MQQSLTYFASNQFYVNNHLQISLQVTVSKLSDIFLVYIGWFLNFVTNSSVPYNGGSLEGFVAVSSCGKTTHLILFLLPVCFWAVILLLAISLQKTLEFQPIQPPISRYSFDVNLRPLANRAYLKQKLFSFHLCLQTGQFLAECLFHYLC